MGREFVASYFRSREDPECRVDPFRMTRWHCFEARSLLLELAAFRRLSAASASLLAEAERRPHGRFVLAYQYTQGRKLQREQSIETELAGVSAGPGGVNIGGSTLASKEPRRVTGIGSNMQVVSRSLK